jgi:L-rhamnose 1-dehydrogenase
MSISSITAVLGASNLTHYALTKAALLAMSKLFPVEFGSHGIQYNCVILGTIQTTINQEYLDKDGERAFMESRVPLGRLGDPEDSAGAVMFHLLAICPLMFQDKIFWLTEVRRLAISD